MAEKREDPYLEELGKIEENPEYRPQVPKKDKYYKKNQKRELIKRAYSAEKEATTPNDWYWVNQHVGDALSENTERGERDRAARNEAIEELRKKFGISGEHEIKLFAGAYASSILKQAQREGKYNPFAYALHIYEIIHENRPSVKKRLLSAFKKTDELHGWHDIGQRGNVLYNLKRYLEENPTPEKTLTEKVGTGLAVVSVGVGTFFLSSNFTGFAISSLNQTTSNIIGAALFILGIAGAFFYFRKR